MHGFTYSGHPVGAAIALVNLAILEDEGLVANSASMGAYLKRGLKDRVGDHRLRRRGPRRRLDDRGGALRRQGSTHPVRPRRRRAPDRRQQGLRAWPLVRPSPFIEALAFSPPLCITKDECDRSLDLFVDALAAATPELDALSEIAGGRIGGDF